MLKKVILPALFSLFVLSLASCSSYNVREFSPDIVASHQVASALHKKITVSEVSMPVEKDNNQILCRLAGNVYLPNKMKYSQYIKNAFESELIAANRYADNINNATHNLSGNITEIQFDSLAGHWIISGDMQVDKNKAIQITTKSDFGTSYEANSACLNVAQGFEVATQNFVKNVLTNPSIRQQLNK
jgi:hypothetical protein